MGTIISIITIYVGATLVQKAGKKIWDKSLKDKVSNVTDKLKKK